MVVGTHTKDFADQNPHLISTIRDFSHIYETQEKETASRILWAAYFISVIANDKNPFKNLRDDEERRLKIKEEFCKVYSNKYLNLEKIFSSIVLSKEHQLYNIHLRKYEEFVSNLNNLNLDSDSDWKKYLDATSKLEKITKFYDDLAKKFNESVSKSSSKEGGGSFTVAEKRNMQNLHVGSQ